MGLNLEEPKKMYVYELPYDITKELCRLLDNEDYWKELAGNYMKYPDFDVNEIEQKAKREYKSPTRQLLSQWGQLNHKVDSLFILLYRMNHVPALRCLSPVVHDERIRRKLDKLLMKNGVETSTLDVNANNANCRFTSDSLQPIPVMQIEKYGTSECESDSHLGAQTPSQSKPVHMATTTDASSSVTDSRHTSSQGDKDSDDELRRNVSAIPMLTYDELREATNEWSQANLLGRGGFGQVFKGVWRQSHVAVKRLRDNGGQNRELIREISSLNKYRHDNILPLYGYSVGGPEVCLIYQYMAGGSLEQRLRSGKYTPLSWAQRFFVAHGVARGLQFLHTMTSAPLIHGDIKPANILLDQCCTPKIGDFGLARTGPDSNDKVNLKVSKVHGTRPYLPQEYLRDHYLYPSVDVFSFGVVLLEIATALPVIDRSRPNEPLLSFFIHQQAALGVHMATFEDQSLKGTANSNPQLCIEFTLMGVHCTQPLRKNRPDMLDVYKQLDKMKDMFIPLSQVVS